MKIKVLPGQSLIDIAIQYGGSITTIFDIAGMNQLSVTSELQAGQELDIPKEPVDKLTVKILQDGDWNPASAEYAKLRGIGFDYIGIDFQVWPGN